MDGSFILERSIQMPYDVPVKQYLLGKGVAGNDIGWDKNSGNVTVRNQPFYKPELNMSGTTFSNQNNLDNAYSNYSKAQPVIQSDGSVGSTANTGQPATSSTPGGQGAPSKPPANSGYTNPYTSMIADVMKHLTDTYNQPQQDVYSTPQYAAAKANQDRVSADSQRHASESAAGAGLGHSTIMTDRTQHIQNDNDNYLTTQLVPQIQSQLAQERQAQIANEQNQFNNLLGLSDRSDNQYNSDRTFKAGRQDAETQATGYYNPSGMSLDEINQQIKQNSDAYATATPEQQHDLHTKNIELNNLLGKTYDPKTGTYSGGDGHVGTKTIQAKQLDSQLNEVAYNHARDSLLDKRYEVKFNQDIKQQGFENALKIAVQKHQISNDNAQLAISQQNADTSKANSDWAKDDKNPDNIYKNAEIDALKNKPTKFSTAEEFSKYVDGTPLISNIGGIKTVSDPIALETLILNSGMTPQEMTKAYLAYKIPMK